MTRFFRTIPIMIALMLALAACGGSEPTPEPSIGQPPPAEEAAAEDEVIATVNGSPIMRSVFDRELARFEAGQAALGFVPEPGYQQQVLDLLIEQELIRQRAVANGVVVSDDQVNAELTQMVQETGQEYFDGWLQGNYYTLDEFREVVRLDLTTRSLLEPVIAGVPQSTQQVNAKHILVNSETDAQAVLDRLAAGETFEALAAEYSVDVTTRETGGDLGFFPRGGLLVPQVEEVAFSQQPGQTSGIVSSDWGYHVVQTVAFQDDAAVGEDTRQRLIQAAIDQWQLGLRADADIQQFVTLQG